MYLSLSLATSPTDSSVESSASNRLGAMSVVAANVSSVTGFTRRSKTAVLSAANSGR